MLTHYHALALRNLRKTPGAAVINVLTLALGLVAAVTAYAFVAFTERSDAHFPNVDRTYLLRAKGVAVNSPSKSDFGIRVPAPAAAYLQTDFPAIEKIARAITIDRKAMVAGGGNAVPIMAVAVDPEFLELFALPFVAGDSAGALAQPGSVVLTQEQAKRLFGDRDPMGQPVVLANSVDATVTGVIAAIREPSHFGRTQGAALPFDMLASMDLLDAVREQTQPAQIRQMMQDNWFDTALVYLRLPEQGLSAESLNAQLRDFAARHVPSQVSQRTSYEFDVTPLRSLLSIRQFQNTGVRFGTLLLVLGGLVLGVACVNYANLATARAARRAREIGVRKALGAPPRQIMLQSLVEAGLLTASALVVAMILFLLARPVVSDLLGVDLASTLFEDARIWPFFAAVALGVTLAAGFYPAFVLSRVQPASAMASADVRLGSRFFSLLLVGTQFAIASFLVLAVTIVSLQNAAFERSGLGLTEDPLVILENPTAVTKVDAATLRAELERLPQLTGVTEVLAVPWEMQMTMQMSTSPDPSSAKRRVIARPVGRDFFDVFDIPMLAGRGFNEEDFPAPPPSAPNGSGSQGSTSQAPSSGAAPQGGTGQGSAPRTLRETNIIVDRSFTAAFGFASPEAAIGQAVYMVTDALPGQQQRPAQTHRIVGVAQDRVFAMLGPQEMHGTFYTAQPGMGTTVARVARTDLAAGLAAIDAMWKALAPNVALTRRFLDDIFNNQYQYYVRISKLFGALALLAFVISIAGLFAMATLVAARRRQEVGVRKTLGARTRQIVTLLLSSFAKPVVVANLVAWPVAFVAARIYLKQFPEAISLTPLPFVGSLVLMLAIACLAVGTQIWRAARLKPAEVLHHD